MTHALICSIGGLVIARHNKACDKLLYLSQLAFTPAPVRAETLIHKGRIISQKWILQVSDKDKETRGDVMIQGLWYRKVEAIIEVKLDDSDTD